MGKWSKYERRYSAHWEKESDFKDWIQKVATDSPELSCVFALIRLPFVIHAIIFGLFLSTFCDHFLASFGEQFGYKIFLHLATLYIRGYNICGMFVYVVVRCCLF